MLETLPMGPLMANCYLLFREEKGEAVLIDPSDAGAALDALKQHGLKLTHILLTHRHFDHLAGVAELGEQLHPEIFIHALDAEGLWNPTVAMDQWMGGTLKPSHATRLLEDGETFSAAGYIFRVLHTPGHTAGGVCYVCEKEQAVFTGDTVFCEGVGRTDLPSGNIRTLVRSACDRILTLPESYVLYPGHGEVSTVGHEVRFNPIIRYRSNPWFN